MASNIVIEIEELLKKAERHGQKVGHILTSPGTHAKLLASLRSTLHTAGTSNLPVAVREFQGVPLEVCPTEQDARQRAILLSRESPSLVVVVWPEVTDG